MSSPPVVPTQRKVKLVNALKAVQSEQVSKLQAKVQLEHDLLEDIKTYAKLRAAAEKDYAQALQKISSQLLSKFQNKDQAKEEEIRTPYGLWRLILEETDAAATTRMNVSQKLLSDVTESIKVLKPERALIVKQCSALSEKLQEEMVESATELTKAQKSYNDFQKVTQQANEQLADTQEKIKKGTTGIFSSKAKLEQKLSKSAERRDAAEKRSANARNEYLLSLAAMNGHQLKYYGSDLPDLLATQDGDIYERLKQYYISIVNTELEALNQCVGNLTKVDSQVQQLERAFAIQLFLKENTVFTKCTPFEFIPAAGDKISTISKANGAELSLNKEARKWTTKLAKEQKLIRKKTRELKKLQAAANTEVKSPEGTAEQVKTPEQTVESVTEELRHLEVLRTKSEARVEALRQADVNVEEWLQNAGGADQDGNQSDSGSEIEDNLEDNEFSEEEEWGEPSIPNSHSDDALSTTSSQDHRTLAVAIYAFQATSQEELSIFDGEQLEVIESEGDGWCRTKNKNGQIGFVPESYIEFKPKLHKAQSMESDRISRASSISGSFTQPENNQEIPIITDPTPCDEPVADFICYAKATYDYEACEDEELTFDEGAIIQVTSKIVDDDDSWWEGVLNGKRGVFPSIVVEEMKTTDDSNLPDNRPRVNTAIYQSSTLPRARDENRRARSMDFDGMVSNS